MPRRPRPAHRPAPKAEPQSAASQTTQRPPAVAQPAPKKGRLSVPKLQPPPDADSDSADDNFFVQGSSKDSDDENDTPILGEEQEQGEDSEGDEDEDEDVDAPRVVQWVDEDDLDEAAVSEDDELAPERPLDLTALQDDLSVLPLGSLRKAQRQLALATVASDEEDSAAEDDNDDDAPEAAAVSRAAPAKGKEKEWSTKPRSDIAKRAHKHAPTEVTSKRPVTRFREVVETPKSQARDPRFSDLSGTFDAQRFAAQYGFLADMHQSEHASLRENLQRARKLLASSPRDLRAERAAEVTRLEAALRRTESTVAKDKRERVEREALERFKKEEREKRKQGKGAWYMPNAEKKDLLVKARYEALAAEGGRKAVRKAIEKKQRKIGQKEKRSRPYLARPDSGWGGAGSVSDNRNGGQKRNMADEAGRPPKRVRA